MAEAKTITVLDVGSTKVVALVGEATDNEAGFTVIGVGIAAARGIRRGQIINLNDATASVREALAGAQASSGVKASHVLMSISGGHIASQNSQGAVAIGRGDQGVSFDDISRCLESAQAITVPNNREILHVIPRHFRVDDQDGVRNPIGMLGFRLEAQAHIITCATTAMQNLLKCAHLAGVEVSEFVLSPLASAEAVLTPTEREMGAVLVDIGGGTTGIALFIDGSAWYTKVLEIGGAHFTSDLAQVLRLPMDAAEHLKVNYGHAHPPDVPGDHVCEIAGFGDEPRVRVLRREAAEILRARADELFSLVEQEIRRSGYDGLLPAGLVITGGGSLLPGIRESARETAGRPVRLTRPMNLHGLVDALQSPAFSTAVGMLHWGLQGVVAKPSKRRRFGSGLDLPGWLRNLLPS
ncbi:MAG: cell division protein FtsA [Thermoflexales bacterium]|nr:cell division protein FtsA [Thermoflexales bacterium]MDW8351515.1 cell division protein FtsA [Anaerolineae bacterium]